MRHQGIVIDELLLRLEPLGPAVAADRVENPLTEFVGKRLESLPFTLPTTADTGNGRHGQKVTPGYVPRCGGGAPFSYSPRFRALTPLAVPSPVASPAI